MVFFPISKSTHYPTNKKNTNPPSLKTRWRPKVDKLWGYNVKNFMCEITTTLPIKWYWRPNLFRFTTSPRSFCICPIFPSIINPWNSAPLLMLSSNNKSDLFKKGSRFLNQILLNSSMKLNDTLLSIFFAIGIIFIFFQVVFIFSWLYEIAVRNGVTFSWL